MTVQGVVRRGLAAMLMASAVAPLLAAVSVVDDSGKTVTLEAPARRIVSLAPHITEQLFAIGAGERIVGTTDYADFPPPAKQIIRVARAHSVDLESIARSRPDLIVTWGSGFPPATQAALGRLGVPVYVNEPGSLERIATSLERLGQLTGSETAPQVARELRRRVDALAARYAQRKLVRVFYQVWQQPLMTLSGRHVVSEALRLCGARNVFEDLGPIAPQVSVESVIAARPDLIATAEAGAEDRGALAGWQRFAQIPAVANRHLITLDADRINRHTPRLVDEVERLCEHIDRVRPVQANG